MLELLPWLIVVLIIALFVGAGLWTYRIRQRQAEYREETLARLMWDGKCPKDHPFLGYSCQRKDYHAHGHHRIFGATSHVIQW